MRFTHPNGKENWEPFTIEEGAWCGANVTILCGLTFGMGCVIGPGSVVTKNIPPYVIATGNYCRPRYLIFLDDGLIEYMTTLEKDTRFAEQIIDRRKMMLGALGLDDLAVIDRKAGYGEFKS